MRAVAIINGNARGLRGRRRAQLEAVGGTHARNVRFTDSLDEARTTVRAEIRRGVDLIVLGGGDGTVVMGLTLIGEACRGLGRPEPAIGILRMGSGNAIADTVNAGDDVVGELGRLARGAGARRSMPLLEVLGVRAPFVGMGVDAQLLEDQAAVWRVFDRVPGGRFVSRSAPRA